MCASIWDTFFERELTLLGARGLLRDLHALPETGGEISLGGRSVLNFSSNDYLGLARDQRLKDAATQAIRKFGCGSTASRLMAGHLSLHEELECDLARMMGTEAALVFGSGFLTNLGVLSTVASPSDAIFSDRLNHASLIDGIRLSRARCYRYLHRDLDHLETLLKKGQTTGKRIIVSESVFSMDGDLAPVAGLAELAQRYDALLVLDEAHAIGVMGRDGGGVCRIPGRETHPQIVVGTLSKALGGYGGFVACSRSIRRFLINKARSFIFSTGIPPACLGSSREAVSVVAAHPQLGETLLGKARRFRGLLVRRGLKLPEPESQILPVLVGDNDVTVDFSRRLLERGLLIRAVRPPTVPVGTARVRLSITLALTDEALEKASDIIAQSAREVGIV
ncbi:MAG: 8-amino-7-oxononanoate synthase [Dehalococcoidales bacterium]|nr:8-amino-7-oxononanoate synthase [Dehalococcoidales bacterium]